MLHRLDAALKSLPIAGASGLLAGCLAVATTILGGWSSADYSHTTQFISELGAVGATQQALVNFAGFLPIAILTLGFVVFGRSFIGPSTPAGFGWWLLTSVVVGYGVAAFYPCDSGCPAVGSGRQAIHNLAGIVEYFGCVLGLMLIGASGGKFPCAPGWVKRIGLIAGLGVAVGFVLMAADETSRGLWQRLAETSIFGWMGICSVYMLKAGTVAEESSCCPL